MHFVDRHREKIRQSPMSSRLLWACLLLVVLLVLTFGAALFLFASLHNTKKDISRSLQIQFSVFQNDMERYFDQLAVMGVNLSEDMSAEVDKELALRQMSFAQLNDSPEVLNALEEKMIEPLCRRLRLFRRFCAAGCHRQHPHGGSRAFPRRAVCAEKRCRHPHRAPAAVPGQCGGGQGPQRDAPPQVAHGVPDRPVPGLRPLDDPRQRPAVPVLHADRAFRAARHLGGGAVVFAAPAGAGRHDVRAVRL